MDIQTNVMHRSILYNFTGVIKNLDFSAVMNCMTEVIIEASQYMKCFGKKRGNLWNSLIYPKKLSSDCV